MKKSKGKKRKPLEDTIVGLSLLEQAAIARANGDDTVDKNIDAFITALAHDAAVYEHKMAVKEALEKWTKKAPARAKRLTYRPAN